MWITLEFPVQQKFKIKMDQSSISNQRTIELVSKAKNLVIDTNFYQKLFKIFERDAKTFYYRNMSPF